ncbi:MAG: efflux RND transporter permease subunit [Planctomycetota bacterium]|jgi:multidrug efflux pump subunit AcrB
MIRFFAGHPTASNLLMLILLLMGVFSLPTLRRSTFPDFTEFKVEVRVLYPGAVAEDVEDAICRRIESAVESIEQLEEIVSEARENVGIVTLKMVEEGDMTMFLSDIKAEVEAIDDFPEKAEAPIIKELLRTEGVVSIAVAGDMSATDLKAYCEELKEKLLRVPEVSLVTIRGFAQRQFRIEVPASTLMQYGVSADDLARVVGAQSLDLPAGTIESDEIEVMVRFTDERRSVEEFENLVVVSGATGGEIRLGDVAKITDVFEPAHVKTLYNGHRAGILKVEKTKEEDVLTVYDAVTDFVEHTAATAPKGVTIALTQDVSKVVRDRLGMLVRNGWQGLILVFLTMWLFFGLRYSFWVAMGLPVAFLGAFFLMPLLGLNIDMLTMVALLMALGLMMDDAIVLAESIATEVARGDSVLGDVVEGVRKVAAGVLSSFLTTCSVFIPLAFLEGSIGKVLLVMPITLLLVLAVSLIEAFLILPGHLTHSIEKTKDKPRGKIRRSIDRAVEWTRENVVGRVVDAAVRWRYLTLGLVLSIFLVSVGFVRAGHIGFKAFPDLEGDILMCRILLPQGTPLTRTEQVVGRITRALEQVNEDLTPRQPKGQPLVKSVTVAYNENQDAREEGPHLATITADLLSTEVRNAALDDVIERWRGKVGRVPDVLALSFTEPAVGPAGRPIEIRIGGDDLEGLKAESLRVQRWFTQFKGVEDVMDDLRPGKPEFSIRMRPGARTLGFQASDVASQLRTAFFGTTAAEIQVGPENYEIDVRLARQDRSGAADIDFFHLALPNGQQVPLGTVATVEESRGLARIARVDRRRTVTVIGDVDSRYANTAVIMGIFGEEVIPGMKERGFDVSLEGEMSEGAETQKSMMRALLIGMIGVFVLLSFQFRSYLEPITVMLAIPFALIGVIWGHWAMGLALTMPSIMGFASLAGVVVNDSILLVAFLKRRRERGEPTEEAARAASRDRFRAILITSLTTVAGLLPLLAETSLQAQVLIPLAAAIVFGLMTSTVLVLFVVPTVCVILGDLKMLSQPGR